MLRNATNQLFINEMKNSRYAFMTLGVLSGIWGNFAYAQNSVNLYGVVDAALNYQSNAKGSSLWRSGSMRASRWGLRGTEELGGEVKAIFTLEGGFDAGNGQLGQNGLLFGRQAFVGLASPYGTMTVGRQTDSVIDYVSPFEVGSQWGSSLASHPGDLDEMNGSFRLNNTVKYKSVNYNGLVFGGSYSFGGQAGFSRQRAWSAGATYANGPLTLGAAYLNVNDPYLALYHNGAIEPVSMTPVYAAYTSAEQVQMIGAGGAYVVGLATVGLTISNTRFKNIGARAGLPTAPPKVAHGSTVAFNNVEINFKYQLTPALLAGMAYHYTQGSSIKVNERLLSGATYHQVSAGVDYFLSKRTDIYLVGAYQLANGHDSSGGPAVAAISGLIPSSSNRQAAVRMGIRHTF